jgi:hypothetical protein
MTTAHPELPASQQIQRMMLAAHPRSGTVDDDDNKDDEHESENEASVRKIDKDTGTTEEFEADDEDELGG